MEIRKTEVSPITQTHTFAQNPPVSKGESKIGSTAQDHISFVKDPKKIDASLTPNLTEEVQKAANAYIAAKRGANQSS